MSADGVMRHPGAPAPHMARRHYPRVLAQLLVRMRLDLSVFVAICFVSFWVKPFGVDGMIKGSAMPILGIAVSVFLGFRNTQAINRWWEARGLWGSVVNQSRQWRETLLAVLGPADHHAGTHRRLLQLQVLMVWLANLELRNFALRSHRQRMLALAGQLGFGEDVTLLQVVWVRAEALHRLRAQGLISDLGRDALLRSAEGFTTALGGLQKIRNTPIPPAYDVFVRLIAWVFGYDLYLDFTSEGRPLTGAMLFLGFLVAERIGAYVEGPFDRDGSSFSLPLNTICSTITTDLMERPLAFGSFEPSSDPTRWH